MKIINKIIYFILHLFWIFPTKKSVIYLSCFDGKKIGYDQLALVNYSNKNKTGFSFIWAVEKVNDSVVLENVKFVKYKSLKGIIALITSGVAICNIGFPPLIPLKKNQIRINTWHGFGPKAASYSSEKIKNFNRATFMLSPAAFFTENVIRNVFSFSGRVILSGQPRNDVFFNSLENTNLSVRKKLCISKQTKIILYAPTFRSSFNSNITQQMLLEMSDIFKEKYGSNFRLLIRMHPLINSKLSLQSECLINVSDYDDMQDLLCCSDVLITDYSSCSWDFSLTKKPVFIFAFDYDCYSKCDRGLLYDLKKLPYPFCTSINELKEAYMRFDKALYLSNLNDFFAKFGSYENGSACDAVFKIIKKELNK